MREMQQHTEMNNMTYEDQDLRSIECFPAKGRRKRARGDVSPGTPPFGTTPAAKPYTADEPDLFFPPHFKFQPLSHKRAVTATSLDHIFIFRSSAEIHQVMVLESSYDSPVLARSALQHESQPHSWSRQCMAKGTARRSTLPKETYKEGQ
jgi:hypothetical protein